MTAITTDMPVRPQIPAAARALETTVVRRHTQAPLRMAGSLVLFSDQATVFAKISEPDGIASWFGMIRGGSTDHAPSLTPGDWGEGSKRYCNTWGMGTLDETIRHWDPPNAYAYNVKNFTMPVRDHLAVMTVEALGSERSRFTWLQYFDWRGVVLRHVFPHLMIAMMNAGLARLGRQLDGEPGRMHLIG